MDQLTQELVAIKTQPVDTESASREIGVYETLRAFPHRNICRMIDRFVAHQQELRIVFEYCPTNIMKIIQETSEGRNGVIPRAKVVHYVRGIVDALCHLHDIGMAHGDLSMGNILVSYDDTIKVGDFGTAHCAHTYICPEPMATYYVRSPEQWAAGPKSGWPSDSWAVGVVAMALLTGECPFFAKEDSAEVVFPAMVSLLGSVTDMVWPSHASLSGWHKLAQHW